MARKKEEESLPSVGGDVDKLVKDLRRTFSKDDEARMSWDLSKDDNPTDVKEFLSTGSSLLDYVISNRPDGGVPTGKLTEIAGEESSGKSLLCAHIIANCQKKGGLAVYIDTENAAHPAFMKQIGVDLEKLVYLQTGTMEKTFETIENVIIAARTKDAKCPIVILWDSVAATPPQSEIEGDYDPNSRVGVMAKTLAKGLRKINDTVGKERITLVFTNHLKQKVGVSYGDPFYTPGGKAIPYHASVRIRLTSSTKLKDADGNIYAIATKAKVVKTRLGPPHRKCEFDIHFDHGVDDVGSWFKMLWQNLKLIEKRGGYCYYDGPSGEVKFREKEWRRLMDSDPKLREHVIAKIRDVMVVKFTDIIDREGVPIDDSDDDPTDDGAVDA